MVKPTKGFLSIASFAALGVLAACGTTSTGGSTTTGCTGSVTVATELPTSGGDASDGLPTQYGAELAVDQANANHLLGGSCTVNLITKDDASVALGKHDPNLGAANMSALAANAAVVGVVGPFNSVVCEAEAPIANQADLVEISPSCTNPGITQVGADPTVNTLSLRPTGKITFFRVCTTDTEQGAGLAQEAKALNATKAYVFDDQESYGVGLATEFTKDFTAAGGTVVGHQSLPGTTTSFISYLQQAKSLGADLVFFGGTSSNGGGIIRQQMFDPTVGMGTVNFIGGDGISDNLFLTQAGKDANGVYYTVAAPFLSQISSAATFLSQYKASKYATQSNGLVGGQVYAYTANAYDAMNIILQAIKEAITANGGTIPTNPTTFRASVRSNVASIQYAGVIGNTSFNSVGDTTNIALTLYQIQNGAAVAVKALSVTAG
jgi:branched-chain amino acid transport system substrate-binding protein